MIKALKQIYNDIFQRKFKAHVVDDLPSEPKPHLIYIEGQYGEEDFAKFLCPCGCNESITLSTLPITKSSWSIKYNGVFKKNVTLTPSINRMIGCRSHFFIRKGKVVWCN